MVAGNAKLSNASQPDNILAKLVTVPVVVGNVKEVNLLHELKAVAKVVQALIEVGITIVSN